VIPTLAIGQIGRSVVSDDATSDPYFSSVVLLVDASNETNGSTPSTIDVIGKTPTWRNNAQCKTDQFKFGSSSIYLDGTNDRVSFADSADWAMGTGDATWEAWVRAEGSFSAGARIWLCQASSFGAFFSVRGRRNTGDLFERGVSDGTTTYSGTGNAIASDAWDHLAIVRNGANLWGFINGVGELTSTALSGVTLLDSSGAMCLGAYADADSAEQWKGWVDQVRITKGVARYTANFTPPSAPFPHA
jgi:concanavalin A-like lectin/glucanase superfamily protein